MKVMDIIDEAVWTPDCGGKWDLDFPVVSCSTRYWRDRTAMPHFIIKMVDGDGQEIDYETILEAEDYICGETEYECKNKVKQWYKDNILKALQILVDRIKGEQQ